jgi:hypothetical protein
LVRRSPYYDKSQKIRATHVLATEFGRFRPNAGLGEETLWARDQFTVAQVGGLELYEREPTVQAASRESGFLGERSNLSVWDDLAVTSNSRNATQQAELAQWFANEAEERIEPGGTLVLVGQRLSAHDLHRHRLDARVLVDEATGETEPLYEHIVFPSHHDSLCDAASGGSHRQWNGAGDGCLTDEWRLPVRDWLAKSQSLDYATIMQQRDLDPGLVLVQPAWITGGEDSEGFPAVGCFDTDRSWGQHPTNVGQLIDYVSVDPSVSGWWALEWWAYNPKTRFNYLIWAARRKMTAGGFLDWDQPGGKFIGLMEEMQVASQLGGMFGTDGGHPISCWVIESNAAHLYLQQNEAFIRWRRRWPNVTVIPHQTQRNKLDPEMGVAGLLPLRYKTGMKRIPRRTGELQTDGGFIRRFIQELTTYSIADDAKNRTVDTVMADWIGETNLPRIVQASRRSTAPDDGSDWPMPPYLKRQQIEVPIS